LADDEGVEAKGVFVDAPSSSVSAEGFPSVIMTIWRMSFFWRRRMR